MRGSGPILAVLAGFGCVVACSADAPPADTDGGVNGACGSGLVAVGQACAPAFDTCGADEVPLPGGGCRRVGVRECPGGIAGPPDWSCRRIGVQECNPAGGGWGLAGPPDWSCQAIGPPAKCLAGWARVAGGWCEPILPQGKCPDGMMEVIGKTTCQPVGECGSGTWGKIATSSSTVFVDAGYKGGGSDGSQAKPYTTIGAALAVGTKIAVAAGTYKEDVVLTSAYTELVGRCAKLVTIEGQLTGGPALWAKAGPATVRGVTVTGPAWGVLVHGNKVTIDAIIVRDCALPGLQVNNASASATITGSLFEENTGQGIGLYDGGTATVSGCVLRETRVGTPSSLGGAGISSTAGNLVLRDSLVSDCAYGGIVTFDANTTIERSVVRRTSEGPTDGYGQGILAMRSASNTKPAKLVVRDSLLHDNYFGVWVEGGPVATLERTVIRRSRVTGGADRWGGAAINARTPAAQGPATQVTMRQCLVTDSAPNQYPAVSASESSKVTLERTVVQRTSRDGRGIGAFPGQHAARPALTVKDSLVAGNAGDGIHLRGATATVQRSVLRDNLLQPGGLQDVGHGVSARLDATYDLASTLALQDSLVLNNHQAGVVVHDGSDATIERTVVRDTRPRAGGSAGHGLHLGYLLDRAPKATVKDSLFAGNGTAGIAVVGADLTLERSVVRDTQPVGKQQRGYGLELVSSKSDRQPAAKVADCRFSRNSRAGIALTGGQLTLERSVVGETLGVGASCTGWGVVGAYDLDRKHRARLIVSDAVLAGNPAAGLALFGGTGQLRRLVVRGRPAISCAGGYEHDAVGVLAAPEIVAPGSLGTAVPSKLGLERSLIADSGKVGLLILGSSAAVQATEVRETRGHGKGRYGDGVVLRSGSLVLASSRIAGSRRAGLLVLKAGQGSTGGAVFERNRYPVYIEAGAPFTAGDDNAFTGNNVDEVTRGAGLEPPPPPSCEAP